MNSHLVPRTSVLSLVLTAALAAGCNTEPKHEAPDAGSGSDSGSGSGCGGSIAGLDACNLSASFGDIYTDNSGQPTGYSVFLKSVTNVCDWAADQDDNPDPDMRFVKLEVKGTLPGVCPIVEYARDAPAQGCVAIVSVDRVVARNKQILHARGGTVEVTSVAGGTITAKVAAEFPVEAYFTGACAGPVLEPNQCACETVDGDTRSCTTSNMEVTCCNEPALGTQPFEFQVTAARCGGLCACSTDIDVCPCGGADPL